MQPPDRRLAVAPHHLMEFSDALGGVDLQRQAPLDRVAVGIADEVGRAGVDL